MGTPQQTRNLTDTRGLIVYSAACKALAAARSTDEVSKIRNSAAMLRAYAKQAKNRQLEIDAAEIRIRAERRVGELIREQKHGVGLNKGAHGSRVTGAKREPVKDPRPTLAEAGIDKKLSARAQQLASVPDKQFEKLVTSWRERAEQNGDRVTSELFRPKLGVHHSSETPEHYTPKVILDAVVHCLGTIDLDPCSNPGRPNVPATRYFTDKEDGLAQPWTGRVYMNPPYGREIDRWIDKLCADHETREVGIDEALALLPARTDTQWFKRLRNYACCFVEGRLTFIGNDDPAPFPSAVFYLGDDLGKFYECFSGIGDIWQRCERGVSFGE